MRSTLLLAFIVAAAQTVLGQESTTVHNGATVCQVTEIVCKTDTEEICMPRAKDINGLFCPDNSASHGCPVICDEEGEEDLCIPEADIFGCKPPAMCVRRIKDINGVYCPTKNCPLQCHLGTVLAPPEAPDALGCPSPPTCIALVPPPPPGGGDYQGLDCGYNCSTSWGDTCIPDKWVCDGLVDCEDGSDEDEATCGEGFAPEPWDFWADCTDEDHACSSVLGEECIPPMWVCDHIIDCTDESDEDESTCGEGWEDEEFDAWMTGPALYQDPPEYATVPVPIDVETRADARRKATLLKVREARVKARAETVAKSPVE